MQRINHLNALQIIQGISFFEVITNARQNVESTDFNQMKCVAPINIVVDAEKKYSLYALKACVVSPMKATIYLFDDIVKSAIILLKFFLWLIPNFARLSKFHRNCRSEFVIDNHAINY